MSYLLNTAFLSNSIHKLYILGIQTNYHVLQKILANKMLILQPVFNQNYIYTTIFYHYWSINQSINQSC